MLRLSWTGVSVLAAVMLLAGPASAADLSLFVGGVMPGTVEVEDVETSLDNSPVYGFRFRSDFVPSFGMEHTLAFSSDYLFPSGASAGGDARGVAFNSNLILDIPVRVGRAVPFLTAGVGFLRQYGDAPRPVGTRFAVNYGGGVKLPRLVGPVGLRFDLRGIRAGAVTNTLDMLELSAGLTIPLGR